MEVVLEVASAFTIGFSRGSKHNNRLQGIAWPGIGSFMVMQSLKLGLGNSQAPLNALE